MILTSNRVKNKQGIRLYHKFLIHFKKLLIIFLFTAFLINYALNRYNSNLSIDAAGILHNIVTTSYQRLNFLYTGLTSYFANIKSLKLENDRLRRKVLELNCELNELMVLRNQNVELQKLLNMVPQIELGRITARLISIIYAPEGQYALINTGKKHSVEIGDTVVCDKGFMGKVVQVGEFYSKVMLLTNAKLKIPVRTTSGQKGILKGDPQRPHIAYLLRPDKVQEDELLMTCLDSSNLIADIPVARVYNANNMVFANIGTSFEDVRFVSVLKNSLRSQ